MNVTSEKLRLKLSKLFDHLPQIMQHLIVHKNTSYDYELGFSYVTSTTMNERNIIKNY